MEFRRWTEINLGATPGDPARSSVGLERSATLKPSGHSPHLWRVHHGLHHAAPRQKPSLLGVETAAARSVDDLVVAGNQQLGTLENVDFAGFRNDREMSRAVLNEIREQVAPFHPEGRGKAYNDDVRRVYNARYAQGHGVQVQAHLDGDELGVLRKYLQVQDTVANVADAVRAINAGLSNGQQEVGNLLQGAEQALFAERGLSAETFASSFSGLSLEELRKTRDFADSWASSESGKFLLSAAGESFSDKRQAMAQAMLEQRGYRAGAWLDLATGLSLLRDSESEGPGTNATIAHAVNEAMAAGPVSYFTLSRLGNEAILRELGLSGQDLEAMAVSDRALQKAYPDVPAEESRATRTRVLRDLLRVLPDAERSQALSELKGVDLLAAEKTLSKHLGRRLRALGLDSVKYTRMGAMQRANLLSALSKLPEALRQEAFRGDEAAACQRLRTEIQDRWGVRIRRGSEGETEYHRDLPLQTLADLYNALTAMSKGGKIPSGLGATTSISFMVGSPPEPSMTPTELHDKQDPVEPFRRPGESAHRRGKSGFFGECGQDERGHDGVVLYDDSTLGPNGDGPVGLSQGEGTILHELAHAVQLGGVVGASSAERARSDRKNTAEWAALSHWTEPDQRLADGAQGDYLYYYDPAVQVKHRAEVATAYGASDPSEDFAEFSPFFFRDPVAALKLAPEKFLYFDRFMGDFYGPRVDELAEQAGLTPPMLEAARRDMLAKVAAAPAAAGI